jgi:hypothetical protein
MRHLLTALLSFAIAGCWIGDRLYSDIDALPALAPGLYRLSTPDEKPGKVRISILRSGLTEISDAGGKDDDSDVYGFAPLDRQRGTFIVWHRGDKGGKSTEGEQLYLLGQRHAGGIFAIYIPFCDGLEAEIARRAGAEIEDATEPELCRFRSRAALEDALRRLQPSHQKRIMTLAPVGK